MCLVVLKQLVFQMNLMKLVKAKAKYIPFSQTHKKKHCTKAYSTNTAFISLFLKKK